MLADRKVLLCIRLAFKRLAIASRAGHENHARRMGCEVTGGAVMKFTRRVPLPVCEHPKKQHRQQQEFPYPASLLRNRPAWQAMWGGLSQIICAVFVGRQRMACTTGQTA
jgi:hypothetical protein